MSSFVRPGDTVVAAASDYLLLSAYATRRADGAVNLLVINKDAAVTFNAQISLAGFVPWPAATVHSFGIPQDDAARTNASVSAQDVALTNYPAASVSFTNLFAPYSLTLFTFAPAPPQLRALVAVHGQFSYQLQGQPGVPYVIQTSTNLTTWASISTNTLASGTLNLTNALPAGGGPQFRAPPWPPTAYRGDYGVPKHAGGRPCPRLLTRHIHPQAH